MTKSKQLPVALTIAGSDSGGGAGVQADLKTFAAVGVHGVSAITCLTAQNPKQVLEVQSASPKMVLQQMTAVFKELTPVAVKTGMLFSESIILTVVDFLSTSKRTQLIVDPVMIATSGAQLLKSSAQKVLMQKLLPLATLITPNLDEAEMLTGRVIREPEDLRRAARIVHERWGAAALIKGGHLKGCREALDVFYDGHTELMLSAPFVNGVSTHGTGCTYSAAITGYCARGMLLPEAVGQAKEFITQAIAGSRHAGRHQVLNWFWQE